MSSVHTLETDAAAAASRVLARPVSDATAIYEGGNSRVFRIDAGGEAFVLKRYFRSPGDPRNRLEVEWSSVVFLWTHGVRQIPEPIGRDDAAGVGIYRFVPGVRVADAAIERNDIAAAVDFLATLRRLRSAPGSEALPAASDACFAPGDVVRSVENRIARLRAVDGVTAEQQEMHAFLASEWQPRWERSLAQARDVLAGIGIDDQRPLAAALRTLSPSDFGFHNARCQNGQWIFFDFEYFGWDDPAKMVCDFTLHPAVDLPAGSREWFLGDLLDRFADDEALRLRVAAYHPLFALKWCLILLNEFVHEFLARRQFAKGDEPVARIHRRQLDKARRMVERADTPLTVL